MAVRSYMLTKGLQGVFEKPLNFRMNNEAKEVAVFMKENQF